jgi:hypothetical protein
MELYWSGTPPSIKKLGCKEREEKYRMGMGNGRLVARKVGHDAGVIGAGEEPDRGGERPRGRYGGENRGRR